MSKTIHTLRLAPVAIAASLAFANPAFAQETAPADPAPAPAAAAPAIVLPTFPSPAPSAAAAPEPAASTATSTSASTPARTASTRTAPARSTASTTRSAAPAVAAPAAAAPIAAAPSAPAPLPQAAPAPVEPVAAAPAPAVHTAPTDSSGNGLALAGLAGILALGGIAVAASRRRRASDDEYIEDTVDETPVVAEPVDTVTTTYEPEIAPLAAEPAYAATPAVAPIAASSIAMDRVPDTAEGRAEWLERMTDAEPDEANPFRSPKARRRRARLIMQGMIARQEAEPAAARSEVRSGASYDWNSLRPAATPAPQYEDA